MTKAREGIYFLFISAKAMSTLEFFQQDGSMTARHEFGIETRPHRRSAEERNNIHDSKRAGGRRIHDIERSMCFAGGEYLFMPSLSALRVVGRLECGAAQRPARHG